MEPDMVCAFDLTRVVDGDSCRGNLSRVLADLDGWEITARTLRDVPVRLINLDTPERGEPGWAQAKIDLIVWFTAHPQNSIRTYGKDSFGRFLGDVYDTVSGETATEWMLRDRGWLPYSG